MENENVVNVETTNTEPVIEEESKPLTFDEILSDKDYQREFDRRVSKALETAKGKWEAEAETKRTEAEKLAQMKEEEKRAYELEKITKERDELLAEKNATSLKEQAVDIARDYGVDTSLLKLMNFNTIKAEEVEPTIKGFKEIIDTVVEKQVNERMRESTPKTVVGTQPSANQPSEQQVNLNSKLFRNYN